MTATKVGNNIYVTGAGNTLATITSDIADPTWIASIGGGVYELYANHQLHVRPDGELIVGSSGDYSTYERLDYKGSGNASLWLYVFFEASLKMYGDAHMDFSAGSPNWYFAYMSVYGEVIIRGDATYRPSFEGILAIFVTNITVVLAELQSSNIDIQDCDFVNRANSKGGSTLGLTFNLLQNLDMHFLRCRFDGNPEYPTGGGSGRPPYISPISTATAWRVLIEDSIIEHYDNILYGSGISQPAFKGCEFRNNDNYGNINRTYHLSAPWSFQDSWSVLGSPYVTWEQDFVMFEDNTFHDNGGTSDIWLTTGSLLVFKGCDFQDAKARNLRADDASTILIWTGNTFASSTHLRDADAVMIANVYALKVTVASEQAVPIEGASVIVRQKDHFEEWRFATDVAGEINGHPLLDSQCLCVHKVWVSGDPVSGIFTLISDDGNSTYHEVIVSAPGYVTQSIQQVMDQDRVLPVTLVATGAGSIGSTLDEIQARVRRLQDR
jgi:hypothetical protein